MPRKTSREPEMGLTFEKVWAMFQETGLKFKETDRKIGKLGDRLGDLAERLVVPNILDKFNLLGFEFGKAGTNVRFRDADRALLAEVDILLENGDIALAVEVKAKLTIPDVQEHMARMEKLRRYADEHGDPRRLMGAVAGAIIPGGVKSFAVDKGFYVLEQAGDTVKIDVPEGFTPREW